MKNIVSEPTKLEFAIRVGKVSLVVASVTKTTSALAERYFEWEGHGIISHQSVKEEANQHQSALTGRTVSSDVDKGRFNDRNSSRSACDLGLDDCLCVSGGSLLFALSWRYVKCA